MAVIIVILDGVLDAMHTDTADGDADSTDSETDPPLHRRALLAAAGAAATLTSLPTTSAHTTATTTDTQCSGGDSGGSTQTASHDETVETIPCGKRVRDYIDCECGSQPWADGSITIAVCPDCSDGVQVKIEVSGHIGWDPCTETNQRTLTVWTEPGERQSVWFTGWIKEMHTSSSNARIGINQNDCVHHS